MPIVAIHAVRKLCTTQNPAAASRSAEVSDTTADLEKTGQVLPFSSLYVSGKYLSQMRPILRPHIDLEELVSEPRISMLEESIAKRDLLKDDSHIDLSQLVARIRMLIAANKKLSALQQQYEVLHTKLFKDKEKVPTDTYIVQLKELKAEVKELQSQVWPLEEEIMPQILSLPNVLSKEVPVPTEEVVLRSKNRRTTKKLFKMLDHVKLSYINESVYGSIAGPSSVYYVGQMAKLHILATKSIVSILRRNNFIDVTGLDFIKSAVIEASNSKNERHYRLDPLRIDRGSDSGVSSNQQMHLVGNASLEALCTTLIKLLPSASTSSSELPKAMKKPRLFSSGCNYQSNASLPRQYHTVQGLSLVFGVDEAVSEMNDLLDVLWSFYEQFDVACRVIKCNSSQLADNEYEANVIEVWMPSRGDFVPAGRISNYTDYLPNRLGKKNSFFVGCSLDIDQLISILVENYQDENGKIVLPQELT